MSSLCLIISSADIHSSVAQADMVCGSGTYSYGLASAVGDLLGAVVIPFATVPVNHLRSGELYHHSLDLRGRETPWTIQSSRGELETYISRSNTPRRRGDVFKSNQRIVVRHIHTRTIVSETDGRARRRGDTAAGSPSSSKYTDNPISHLYIPSTCQIK